MIKIENHLINIKTFITRRKALFFWFALVLFILPVSLAKIYNADAHWHMQLGRVMLDSWGVPDFSKFYFTPINKTVSDLRFTFLGDILLYLIHLAGGDIGLQFLRLFIVIMSCTLLLSIIRYKYSTWTLVALMLFVVGTYQKQMLRNSIFGLLFLVIIFWLWWKIRFNHNENWIWIYPFVIGVWGCIHGSYLLGYGILAFILVGDIIDVLIKSTWAH